MTIHCLYYMVVGKEILTARFSKFRFFILSYKGRRLLPCRCLKFVFYSVIELSFSIGPCFRVGCFFFFFFFFFWLGGGGGGAGRGWRQMARLKINVTFGVLRIAHYRQIK